MVGRSPGGATALPPSATTMVPGGAFTAAQPSGARGWEQACGAPGRAAPSTGHTRSEEHTSELQSQSNLVCRLLLEKKTDVQSTRIPLSFSLWITHICATAFF